jgi:hypothetical protein
MIYPMGRSFGLAAFLVFVLTACGTNSTVTPTRAMNAGLALTTATQLPSLTLQAESTTCINDARFVEDLSIPDGTRAAPEDVLDKRWAVHNAGTCDWSAGYRLVRIDEGLIEGPEELALYPARAGETGVWSVQITTPDQLGDQMASWQAQAPDGSLLGDRVFVLIEVVSTP